MNLTFVCQSCDDTFEIDFGHLADDTKAVRCPNCRKKLPPAEVDELVGTIDELLTQLAALRRRFVISFDVDADELPAPYNAGAKRSSRHDEDEEEEEEEDDGVAELGEEDEAGEEEDY